MVDLPAGPFEVDKTAVTVLTAEELTPKK